MTDEPKTEHRTRAEYLPGAANGGWICTEITQPPLIPGQDYSDNVWGYEANDQRILVASFFIDADGWHWANAYGDVWGEAEFDDDYDINYWQPIVIPLPPLESAFKTTAPLQANSSGHDE